jgi:dienelactone hydrolase
MMITIKTGYRSARVAPLAIAFCSIALASSARAEVQSREIEYKQGSTVLQGFAAWDDDIHHKRPGVLVVHEWWGHNQHARNQALRLARAGYVAFALDMFGKGKVTTHPADAQAFTAEATKDPKLEKARFDAALAQLKKIPEVDSTKLAAIGYCFGGGVVLDMLRLGAKLGAVATFHGALASKLHAKKGIKSRILVMTGGDDAFVPAEQVTALQKEMGDAGAQVEVKIYPGVKHAFTNPDAAKAGMPALAYDASADNDSWQALLKFLSQTFGAINPPQPAPAK